MKRPEPWDVTQRYIRSTNRYVLAVLLLALLLMAALAFHDWGKEDSGRPLPGTSQNSK
jgi:hypothetical protein